MKIFLSYASEDRPKVEEVQLALFGADDQVFFDRQSLPAGDNFHARIRNAVEKCDIFVFLISPDSIRPGCYALSELRFAERRWPSPKGRVLPVMARPTPWDAIPTYLKAVTVLEPKGSLAAEIADAVEMMKKKLPRERVEFASDLSLREADWETQSEEDLQRRGAPPEVSSVWKSVDALGIWEKKVVCQGKDDHRYQEKIGGVQYLARPSAEFTDDQGRRCRVLRTSKRDQGRWIDLPSVTFVWNEEDWSALLREEATDNRDKSGLGTRRLQTIFEIIKRKSPHPSDE